MLCQAYIIAFQVFASDVLWYDTTTVAPVAWFVPTARFRSLLRQQAPAGGLNRSAELVGLQYIYNYIYKIT